MKITKSILSIAVILSLILPCLAQADGMVIPQPSYEIYENEQKAVIYYEDGVETMIISIQFEGNTKDFAWIVPTPALPKVSKAPDELFTSLDELTKPEEIYSDYGIPLGLGGVQAPSRESTVTVIETQKIDYYDITTLAATDAEALNEWLNEHGYTMPDTAEYILDSYIDNEWYFVAVKIDSDYLVSESVSDQLAEGHATPLKMVFETDKIVYPLKISSVTSDDYDWDIDYETTSGVAPTYEDGKVDAGKAIDLGEDDILSYNISDDFINKQGTIKLWAKLYNNYLAYGKIRQLAGVMSDDNSEILEFRVDKNNKIEFIIFDAGGNFKIYQTEQVITENEWTHLAVTWEEDQIPKIYINGQAAEVLLYVDQDQSGQLFGMEGILYLGRKNDDDYPLKGLLDEVYISNKTETADEIATSYNNGEGVTLTSDNNTTFLAHFERSLTVEPAGDELDYSTEVATSYELKTKSTASSSDKVGILIYVLADGKKELTNFTTDYAGWVKKKDLQKWATDDNGDPWLDPPSDKYFLTRLSRNMTRSQMTSDLYIQAADNNDEVNAPKEATSTQMMKFFIIIGIGAVLIIILIIVIIIQAQKKRHL